jgi:MbtH protein
MANPFDDENATCFVLRNDEGQYSLWPAPVTVPSGWTAVHGPANRPECLTYIEQHWDDMRPSSLVSSTERR